MAVYRRYIIQQKYVDGKPTEEYRLGLEKESTNYHSLEECESGSECTDIEYQWVAVSGDYYCIGNAKYQKLKKQQKCANATEWADVYPYEYKQGDVIEKESKDCGASEKYTVTLLNDTHCALSIVPSQSYYLSTDSAVINFASISDSYLWNGMYYGSSTDNWQFANQSVFNISQFSQNWYFSGVTSAYSEQTGKLYVSYDNGTDSYYDNSQSYITSYDYKISHATIVIDYGNIVTRVGSMSAYANSASLKYVSFPVCSVINDNTFYYQDLESVSFPMCETIGVSAFNRCTLLQSVSFPMCEVVYNSAFVYCKKLQEVYLPNCKTLYDGVFSNCLALSYVNLDNCTAIGSLAFQNCSKLLSLSLPKLSYVTTYAFANAIALKSVSLPNCTSIGTMAFYNCSALEYLDLSLCTTITYRAFSNCTALSYVNLPNCTTIGDEVFSNCTALSYVSLPVCETIGDSAFYNCSNLKDIYLYSNRIVSFYYGVINNCNSSIKIHIPESLCEAYNNMFSKNFATLYSNVSKPYSEIFVCEQRKNMYYDLILYSNNCGSLIVTPSQESYLDGSTVTITNEPYSDNIFLYYMYGSHYNNFEYTTSNTKLSLVMSTDWFVSIKYSVVSSNKLYYSYYDGTESAYYHDEVYLDSDFYNGTNAVIIIDNQNVVKTLSFAAFESCAALSYVNFPVCETIGNSAFYECTALSYVNFPACTSIGSQAFQSCTALSYVNFPVCTSIGSQAFQSCTALEDVNFPVCTSIGSQAFQSCTALEDVNFPACTTIEVATFLNCSALSYVNFPVCETIGNSAFYECTALSYVNFPNCTSIGNGAFLNCSALSYVNLPACTSIGSQAFQSCTALEDVNFPNCTTIGFSAFYNCSALSYVNLPVCETIGNSAFYNCSALEYLSLDVCTNIKSYAFYNCSALSEITLPNCTSIGFDAFRNCTALSYVNFPVCETIGDSAFYKCSALETVILPNIKSTYSYMFGECTALSYVDLTNCESLERKTFSDCPSLRTVILPNCTSIGNGAFLNCSALEYLSLPAFQSGSLYVDNCINLKEVYLKDCYSFAIGRNVPNLQTIYLMSTSVVTLYKTIFASCHSSIHVIIPEKLCEEYYLTYSSSYFYVGDNYSKSFVDIFHCSLPSISNSLSINLYVGSYYFYSTSIGYYAKLSTLSLPSSYLQYLNVQYPSIITLSSKWSVNCTVNSNTDLSIFNKEFTGRPSNYPKYNIVFQTYFVDTDNNISYTQFIEKGGFVTGYFGTKSYYVCLSWYTYTNYIPSKTKKLYVFTNNMNTAFFSNAFDLCYSTIEEIHLGFPLSVGTTTFGFFENDIRSTTLKSIYLYNNAQMQLTWPCSASKGHITDYETHVVTDLSCCDIYVPSTALSLFESYSMYSYLKINPYCIQ